MITVHTALQVPWAFHTVTYSLKQPSPYTLYWEPLAGQILPTRENPSPPPSFLHLPLHVERAIICFHRIRDLSSTFSLLLSWLDKAKHQPLGIQVFTEGLPGEALPDDVFLHVSAFPYYVQPLKLPPQKIKPHAIYYPLFPGCKTMVEPLLQTFLEAYPQCAHIPCYAVFHPKAWQRFIQQQPSFPEEAFHRVLLPSEEQEKKLFLWFLGLQQRYGFSILPTPPIVNPLYKEHFAWVFRLTFLSHVLFIVGELSEAFRFQKIAHRLEKLPIPLAHLRDTGNMGLLGDEEIFAQKHTPLHPIESWAIVS